MELIIVAVVALVICAAVYYNRKSKGLDINADGKIDGQDVKAAVQNVVQGVKSDADVNKDGVVNSADTVAVVQKVEAEVKVAATKVKAAAKKATTRKPKSKA